VKLIVSRAALADLERLRDFLSGKNPDAARRAVSALVRAMQSLDVSPDRGRPSALSGARELIVPFGRSAYILRYAHLESTEEVVILRIWHGREDRD
jgi:plasmid stabilization system protein ParE